MATSKTPEKKTSTNTTKNSGTTKPATKTTPKSTPPKAKSSSSSAAKPKTPKSPAKLKKDEQVEISEFSMSVEANSSPPSPAATQLPKPFLTDYDIYLFSEGSHYRIYEKFGAHITEWNGEKGTYFAVWAPNAQFVSVVGDFNGWNNREHPLDNQGFSGVWTRFIPGVGEGDLYKFYIESKHLGYTIDKFDPCGFAAEMRPNTASMVWDIEKYKWRDGEWMKTRKKYNDMDSPISIYEVHLGSWMRVPEDNNRWLSYQELADKLVAYVKEMGYTHVELMPISEYPFDGSWGYQTVGYFAPTSRYGTPDDFKFLIDTLHQNEIGVLLDWVPAHFPRDGHGLGYFDGTHLYEHEDARKGEHKDWGTFIFNFGRYEVSNFLISNALFWFDKYHIDGVRVDAVASMLYLDYSREPGEWIPNQYGGNENLEALSFIRKLNERIYLEFPDTFTVAEESTAWPQVSKPTYLGGLGFGYKWDMGWMHDTLTYMSKEGIHRRYHHNQLTFRQLYAFTENFVMPLSHDEVVHGKQSLLSKMPGDFWQKFANLRVLFGYMWTQPGKKLLFQGGDIGQWDEWNFDKSVDWHLLDHEPHQGIKRWIKDLNHLYQKEPALYEYDCSHHGFQWVDCNDHDQSILIYQRQGKDPENSLIVAINFTPVPRHNYQIGVPHSGYWTEILNSDSKIYWGSGQGNFGGLEATPVSCHGRPYSIPITLPPLGVVVLKPSKEPPTGI